MFIDIWDCNRQEVATDYKEKSFSEQVLWPKVKGIYQIHKELFKMSWTGIKTAGRQESGMFK